MAGGDAQPLQGLALLYKSAALEPNSQLAAEL
jgi:hypothetical protein